MWLRLMCKWQKNLIWGKHYIQRNPSNTFKKNLLIETAGLKWWQIPSVYIWADNFFILKSLWSPRQPPPGPRVCPSATFVWLPFASFKAEDLQKKHSSGPKIFMGQTQYRNRVWGQDNIERRRLVLSICPKEGVAQWEWADVFWRPVYSVV